MLDSFVLVCDNALDDSLDMESKLKSYEKANTIYYLLSKNLGEFIYTQIKNRNAVAAHLKQTTQRMWIVSITMTVSIVSLCLLLGFIYTNKIAEAVYRQLSR